MARALTRPLAAAAAGALALAPAGTAIAGTCGGGGGTPDTSGASDLGAAYALESTSTSDSTPACTDETDIVGYRRCVKYGSWGNYVRTPLIFELGTALRSFASPLGEATGTLSHEGEQFTYRVVGAPAGMAAPPDAALVSTARIGIGLARGFYLAAEGELGGLVRNASRAEMTSSGAFGAPSLTPGGGLVLGGAGVLGVRGAVGHGTLGVEVAGGVRSVSYSYDSHYLACEGSTTQAVRSPILEARARAALWLSPFVSVGATAGASVIDRGAWMAGVSLGFVTQAFGGLRD